MKTITTRTLFVAMALILTAYAASAWYPPHPAVVSCTAPGEALCPISTFRVGSAAASPSTDILLFMFGMAQGGRGH